jgi:hypothetical protein
MVLGEVVICLQKTETRSMFITLYSINSKWIKELIYEVNTVKSREYSGSNRYRQGFPQQNPSSSATKRKDRQMGPHKIKKFLQQQKKWSLD